ncbi:MAG: hotdog fold thioesterase [Chloroflexota bacterium]
MTSEATETVDVMRVLAAVRERNPVAQQLGIEVEHGELGRVRGVMPVRADMVNSKGTCHGGYIFLLGDQIGGWTCMSHNEQAVTQSAHVTYVNPGQLGDVLVAEGVEVTKTKRSGTYDVTITTQQTGTIVALVRCQYLVVGPTILEA